MSGSLCHSRVSMPPIRASLISEHSTVLCALPLVWTMNDARWRLACCVQAAAADWRAPSGAISSSCSSLRGVSRHQQAGCSIHAADELQQPASKGSSAGWQQQQCAVATVIFNVLSWRQLVRCGRRWGGLKLTMLVQCNERGCCPSSSQALACIDCSTAEHGSCCMRRWHGVCS